MAQKDIESLIKQFDDNHSEWIDRMDSDYEIYTLNPYSLDTESSNVTSPEPRRYADKVIQTAEAAQMLVKVTTPDTSVKKDKEIKAGKDVEDAEDTFQKNKDKESTIERLIYGLMGVSDKNLRREKIIYGRTAQSADIFYAAVRGSIVHRVVTQKKEGKIYPEVLPVDPRYFKFGIDSNGMSWGAVQTWRDPEAIKEEYGQDVDEVTSCIDFWDSEQNIIQIGDEQYPQKHKLGRPPFIFRPVGSAPLIYSLDSKFENIANMGESVFATSRDLYDVKNKLLTIWLSLVEKAHKPGYFLYLPGGKMALEKLPWGTNQIMTLPLDAKAEMIKPPDIANTAPQLYNIIDKEIQANDLSIIEYGIVAGSEYPSGKSMLALQEGKDSKITPILLALGAIFEDTAEMLIEQYEMTGVKTTFKGYDSKGKLFYQEIKPTDVKKPWDVEIKFVSITPEQETQNIAKAQMLLSMGYPFEYVNEKALQMQDPAKPIRQMLLQQLEAEDPIIKKKHQYEAAVREGHDDEAKKLQSDLVQMLQQLSAQGQPVQPQIEQVMEQPVPEQQEDNSMIDQNQLQGGNL